MLQKTIRYFQQNFATEQECKTDYLTLISDDARKIDVSETNQRYLHLLREIQKEEELSYREIDLELVSLNIKLCIQNFYNNLFNGMKPRARLRGGVARSARVK